LKRPSELDPASPGKWFSHVVALTGLVLAVQFCASCRTTRSRPPTDLTAPGWRVQQGQAVWKPTWRRPELAGELLLATRPDGEFLIQFSKTPFPLVVARSAAGQWQIEFGNHDYVRRGRGLPPKRVVWFQLPRYLDGVDPGAEWRSERMTTNRWKLESVRTGETLEGFLSP